MHKDIKPWERTNSKRKEDLVKLVNGISETTLMNHTESSRKTSMILPVYVSHVDNPNVQRLVYAILNSQSDTTFILQNTWKLLGLLGEPVKLKLSTMHAEKKVIDSSKVQGLMVRDFNSQQSIRDIMPAN